MQPKRDFLCIALPCPNNNLKKKLCIAVRVLQAADGVRVRVRGADDVDEPGEPGGGRGLRRVEQRPPAALLRVRLLQGRHAGHPARPVAKGQRGARRRHRRARRRLRHRLQRLQERPDRGPLPPLQVEQHLIDTTMYFPESE